MSASLVGIREKVKRADQHIAEIAKIVESFHESSHCEVVHKFDRNSQRHRYLIGPFTRPPIDPQLPIIVGEAVHQLRSILDHLVGQLIVLRRRSGCSPKGVTWPAFKERPCCDEKKARYSRMVKGILSPAKTAIERLQPYNTSSPDDHPIAVLAVLDNTDKHRDLLVVAAVVGKYSMHVGVSPETLRHWPALMKPVRMTGLEKGAEIRESYIAPENVKVHIEPYCDIALTNVGLAKLKSVIPCLEELRNAVVGIVDDFDVRFFQA